jgi:phosphoketolase
MRIELSIDGRVMEMLSEHTLKRAGWKVALTGRHGFSRPMKRLSNND